MEKILKSRLKSLNLYREKLQTDIEMYERVLYEENEDAQDYISHVNEALAFIDEYSTDLDAFLQDNVLTFSLYQQVFKLRDDELVILLETLQTKYLKLEKTPQ